MSGARVGGGARSDSDGPAASLPRQVPGAPLDPACDAVHLTLAFHAFAGTRGALGLHSEPVTDRRHFCLICLWARAYLSRRFNWHGQSRMARRALMDDAIQHLGECVLRGKARSVEGDDIQIFVSWCKRVLDNFVITEYRRQSRKAFYAAASFHAAALLHGLDLVYSVETRELVNCFVALLRRQVERGARQQNLRRRLALLDEFLDLSARGNGSTACHCERGRHYQRVSRGRVIASCAWAELKGSNPAARDEFHEVAVAMGLELGKPIQR
jgi:hypothetical protein